MLSYFGQYYLAKKYKLNEKLYFTNQLTQMAMVFQTILMMMMTMMESLITWIMIKMEMVFQIV